MLKFIKSKAFKVAGLVVALVLIGAVMASATTFTTTMKQGSQGGEVAALQTLVGATADGNFGPLTKASVQAWQRNNALTPDGVFGPLSRAVANGGASIATGSLCPNGMTLASNCSLAPNAQAVALCPNGMTVSSNCATAPTAGTTTTGPLVGGAGSATITELSTPSASTKVGEGDVGTKVYGVEVEADSNSDLSISSMKITLSNSGSGSKKLDRYAKSVSIWYNGAKVGSADASAFSEDSNTYSKSIPVTGVVIKAGLTGKVYFAIDAIADIDSGNVSVSYNTWTITVTSTRYSDGLGVVLTDTTASLANTFIFDSLASTKDVELKVGLSASTTPASTVKLSTATDTSHVELMKFTMKAQGSKMFIDQIPVLFTTSEDSLSLITSNVTLEINGETFNEALAANEDATQNILFDKLGIEVAEGDTITGTIFADMNDIETTDFDEGTTLDAAITSALVVATSSNYIDVEDSNGDQLATGDRTGSAQGNTMTFRSTGVNVVMGTPTYGNTTETSGGTITSVIYTIPVSVTAFGNTLYMGQTALLADSVTLSNAFSYVFQNSTAPSTTDVGATSSATISSVSVGSDPAAVIEGTSYRLDSGLTKHFIIEVTLTTPSVIARSYRVALKEIRTFATSTWTTALSSSLVPTEQFKTAYKYIAS